MEVLKISDKEHGPDSMVRESKWGFREGYWYGQSCALGRVFLAALSRRTCPIRE